MLKARYILLVMISFFFVSCQEELTGEDLLNKSINYHDPESNWPTFNGVLNVTKETPNQPKRDSEIHIDLPNDSFYLKAVRDTLTTTYEVKSDRCRITFNGRTEFTEEEIKTHRLDCDRAKMYRNYYTYLYGLPMKLKDPGTHVSALVERKTFKGKEYLVLKATYDENVGSDVWFFYFDPETYAMEIYQFYKTDENGNMKTDSGEYILLTEESVINDIKMPKVRAWYYNKDDGYLGTDILN